MLSSVSTRRGVSTRVLCLDASDGLSDRQVGYADRQGSASVVRAGLVERRSPGVVEAFQGLLVWVKRLMGFPFGFRCCVGFGSRCASSVGPSDASHPMGRSGRLRCVRVTRSGFVALVGCADRQGSASVARAGLVGRRFPVVVEAFQGWPVWVKRFVGLLFGFRRCVGSGSRCASLPVSTSYASHPMGCWGGCAVWRIGRSGVGAVAVTGDRCASSVGTSDASHPMGRLGELRVVGC
jgi:hypothetical protein